MRVVLVSGMSGAGRSTALRTFEDIGFEAMDNVPLGTVAAACSGAAADIAIGLDVRSRGFSAEMMADVAAALRADGVTLEIILMIADSGTLIRRFSETRRKHPLAIDRPVEDGIASERELLKPIMPMASEIIDTSSLTPGELRQIITARYGEQASFTVSVMSFSYARGVPREADLVLDVRFLRNPHYVEDLRMLTGTSEKIAEYIKSDSGYEDFITRLKALLELLMPRYSIEGKSYLTIAFGCTGGRHRSVCLAVEVGEWLRAEKYNVLIKHRDI